MALGDPVLNEVALLGDLPAGGFKIKNLAAGAVAGDSARYDELNTLDGLVIKKDGSVAFTADQPMGGNKLTGFYGVEFSDVPSIEFRFPTGVKTRKLEVGATEDVSVAGSMIEFYGSDHATKPGWLVARSKGGFTTTRLTLKDGAEADALWEACIHKGLKLGGALDASSQKITNLLAPTAEGDALSKGDAVLVGTEVAVVADKNVIGGIPVIHRIDIAAGALAETDVTLTHKTRVVDAWVVMTGAGVATTTLTVQNAANAITDAMDVSGADKSIVRAGEIDDDNHEILASGILRVKTEVGASQPACTVYVLCIRVA